MADSSLASGFRTGFGSAFLQFALERFASFGSLAWREISVIWGVEDELRKLQRTFFKIQDLVDHVDGSPLRFYGGSNAWRLWFEDMRKLAYDADALLDHVSLHLSTYCAHHSITSNQEKQVLPMVLSSFKKLKLPHEISKMQKKLDRLAREMESLVMTEKAKFDAKIASRRSSCAIRSAVVGRVEEKEYIVNLLSKECENSKFSVISIMGMGGIGKTTLARHVYDDEKLSCDFALKIWVSVSVDFDAIRITKSIIEYATLCACNLSDLESLQLRLQSVLRGEKFLLALDDYWSEKSDDWDILSWPFKYGLEGSKVIVTTRSTKVSSVVCSSEAQNLEILSDDGCWELIKQRAKISAESSRDLESVGRQIAVKCKGIPLVATTLGNMLRCKSTEEEWRFVLENELWDVQQDDNIFPCLMQSYLHLPAHLQKCFAYCSIFPQGYKFEMEELILLWVAEGYVKPTGAQTLEDLARSYFKDLYLRFFFQQDRSVPNQTRYIMHDLMHAMSRLVSKDICFSWKLDMVDCYPLFGNACHLSFIHDDSQTLELKASVKNERLRTFLLISQATTELDPQLFSHLKFLRVLGLSNVGLSMLVDSIDQLKYLRYLNLSKNPIFCLPKSMCKLVALQILKLRNCSSLCDLPEEMSNLINLRHLDFDKNMFKCLPPHFGKLTNLQYLSAYIVGRKIGCDIEELKSLNCLRGTLCITNIDVSNASGAKEAKLGLKTSLDKLELEWKPRSQQQSKLHDEEMREQAKVLANLQPHPNLKELVIRNYCGIIYPAWLSNPSHTYTSIQLQGLKYCDHLPSLGELPSLTFFAISDMPSLKLVDHNFYGISNAVKFPSLKSFQLRGMSYLTQWKDASDTNPNENESSMPRLITYTLHDCEKLCILPPKLQSLRPNSNVSGCPGLQP